MKKYFMLITMMLVLPNCGYQKLYTPFRKDNRKNVLPSNYVTAHDEPEVIEEDIDSFVMHDDGNPFTTAALTDEQQDFTLEQAEIPAMGDKLEDSIKYGFKTLYFDFDRYNIRPDQRSTLQKNLQITKDLTKKGYEIVVEGHACDSAGSPHYNLMLSEDRATVVTDYLVEQGVPIHKVHSVGRGAEMCIVPYGDRKQQAPNRRVEIYAYQQPKS